MEQIHKLYILFIVIFFLFLFLVLLKQNQSYHIDDVRKIAFPII